MEKVTLIGRPNSGKSSLFNQLTGLNQKTANFAGVTVEQHIGRFQLVEIADLPGLHSLQSTNADERIAIKKILSLDQHDHVLFVANGMQLTESLELYSQIADLQIPILLAINFGDEMQQHGVSIDLSALQGRLGCPVVVINAKNGDGIDILKQRLSQQQFSVPHTIARSLYDDFAGNQHTNQYRSLLENEMNTITTAFWQKDYRKRRQVIRQIVAQCVTQAPTNYLSSTQRLDRWLLHPVVGVLIFLAVMFLLFQSIFVLADIPVSYIEQAQDWLINAVDHKLLKAIITGLGSVLVFVPPIAILFFLLGVLEHSGYLSRISFIADAFLKKFGLSGHSIVPLMSSWACAIPAIMSTRMITNPRERFAVLMAAPLMTCSARLPVYAILIYTIFPAADSWWGVQGLAMMLLYLMGLVATLSVAWLVNKNSGILPASEHWLLELPVFRQPNWKSIAITVYQKTASFVVQTGKIIVLIAVVLYMLSSNSPRSSAFIEQQVSLTQQQQPHFTPEKAMDKVVFENSYLRYMGEGVGWAVQPLGYDWKVGIALLSSFAAREVFSPTLATIYSIEETKLTTDGSEAEKQDDEIEQEIAAKFKADLLKQHKNVTAVAVSLMMFYIFAMQCMSTFATVRRETQSWYYAFVQFLLMFVLAYVFAFIAYQLLNYIAV